MDPALLDAALDRSPLGEDGRSGAHLERVRLADGRRVVVKRYDPSSDLLMRMLGDGRGREIELFRSGVLDRLPPVVHHCILDGWYDADGLGVLVMRDLGESVLTWHDRVPLSQARTLFQAVAQLHGAFAGRAPVTPTPLGDLLGLFEVPVLRRFAGADLVDAALRGWGYWPDVAPGEVGDAVLALAHDLTPLVEVCAGLPATLLHGDLSTVNMAFEPDRPGLTLIDWGMAAAGPAELDVGRLLAGCAHLFDGGLDDLLALHRESVGLAYDEQATRLGLLAGLVWLGWNKALDIVDHPDREVRERERTNLAWWLDQAGAALESGVV